jgi:hypothetical protein
MLKFKLRSNFSISLVFLKEMAEIPAPKIDHNLNPEGVDRFGLDLDVTLVWFGLVNYRSQLGPLRGT